MKMCKVVSQFPQHVDSTLLCTVWLSESTFNMQKIQCLLFSVLSIFLSLLEAADLKDLLSQPGDWTLFAPTNEAFKGMTNEEREILIGE